MEISCQDGVDGEPWLQGSDFKGFGCVFNWTSTTTVRENWEVGGHEAKYGSGAALRAYVGIFLNKWFVDSIKV